MNNLFVKPEKPFLLCFQINKTRDYIWCESEEEVIEVIEDYKRSYDDFVIDDVVEIGSLREIKIDKMCGNCENYQPYACEQKVGCCKDISMLDVRPSDRCYKVYR